MLAVSDHAGSIADEDGIDAFDLTDWVQEHGSVKGYPNADEIEPSDLWSMDVDILIPAALENQINVDNANDIRAKVVVEAANGAPVWAKMTPNITDITQPALAAQRGGAAGVSAINTILACIGINLKTLRPLPTVEGHSTFGGYSYLAVKPIALRMVAQIARAAPNFSISATQTLSFSL